MSEERQTTSEAPGDAAAEYVGAPGVRFVPTDQELIVHYLRRKLRNEPLPTDLVVDGLDAYAEHPNKLVPKLGEAIEGAWYMFSPLERKWADAMRPKRDTDDGEGRWKAVGAEKLVLGGADGMEVIGAKRVLVFNELSDQQVDALGKRKRGNSYIMTKPTKWKMVEFVVINSSRAPRDDTAPEPMLLNECVLCKITNKSLRAANRDPAQGEEKEENDDDNGEEEPAPDGGGESQEKPLPEQQSATASGGGAGSHGNRQPAAAEAPRWGPGHIAALPHDDYRGAKYLVGVDGSNRSGTNMPSVFGSDDHIGAFHGGGAGSHGNWQPATAGAPSGRQMATLPGDDYRGAKYFVGLDGTNRFGTNRLSTFGSDDHIGAFYGGGAGSHGNRLPATAGAPSGQQMVALPGDDYRGAKYFVGADGSNRIGTNWSASVFGSNDHIGAFYGGGAGSHCNRQPATAEDPSAQQMAALPGYDYAGAKYFVGADGSNWSGTNWSASVFGSDDHTGAFYGSGDSMGTQRAGHWQEASSGGGAGPSPDEQQQPTPEAPNGGGAAATGAASQQSAPWPYYRVP